MKLMSTTSCIALVALCLVAGAAQAQVSDGVIKIGILNDQSGTYADLAGPGSVVAARMAVEDFGATKKGMKVEIVAADHQNKPDVGSQIARQWDDGDKDDVIMDVPTSSVGLANGGADTSNAIKQGAEFGIVKGGQQFAGRLVFLTDVHALGLEKAQGLLLPEAFYWDLNDQTRAWSKRFAERNRGAMPTMAQ